MNRTDLIRRLRSLVEAFTNLQARDGADKHVIGLGWAKSWLQTALDTRDGWQLYVNYVQQQEDRVLRLIRKEKVS